MQSSAMALLLRLNRRSTSSSRILCFSTSNSDSKSNSHFSSLYRDIKDSLIQSSSPSSNRRSQQPSANEIQRNLSEFRAKTAPPLPGDPSQQHKPISFQEIYHRRNMQGSPSRSGKSPSLSMDSVRESVRKFAGAQTPLRQGHPGVIGGTSALPQAIFGKEMRKEGTESTAIFSAGFFKTYGVEDLGKKLRTLRPEGKEKDWFSVKELSERLARLKKIEEEQLLSNTGDAALNVIRGCLVEVNEKQKAQDAKKASMQGFSIWSHLSRTPSFSLEPPKPHLVEKYFHPDNMSSAEKMKIELTKVRDEFKMSESDCGSARVQIAQLTTKIKHLSAVLHKKDVHSRKGLVAMVQRRKRLLKYLRRTDWDSYCFVISKLGLRDNPEHSYRSRTSMAT